MQESISLLAELVITQQCLLCNALIVFDKIEQVASYHAITLYVL